MVLGLLHGTSTVQPIHLPHDEVLACKREEGCWSEHAKGKRVAGVSMEYEQLFRRYTCNAMETKFLLS